MLRINFVAQGQLFLYSVVSLFSLSSELVILCSVLCNGYLLAQNWDLTDFCHLVLPTI